MGRPDSKEVIKQAYHTPLGALQPWTRPDLIDFKLQALISQLRVFQIYQVINKIKKVLCHTKNTIINTVLLLVTKINDKSKVTQNLIQYFQKLGVQKVFYYASIVSAESLTTRTHAEIVFDYTLAQCQHSCWPRGHGVSVVIVKENMVLA